MIETPRPNRSIVRRAQLVALGFLAAAAAASGCAKSTYLEIDFKGPGLPAVRQINLTLTNNSNGKVSAGVLPDSVDAASTDVVKFPASAAFKLDELPGGTSLGIKADAISPLNAPVAHAQANTTVMHAKTWKVTLDFSTGLVVALPLAAGQAEMPAGSAGTSADAGADGAPLDDDWSDSSEDRPAIEVHFTR